MSRAARLVICTALAAFATGSLHAQDGAAAGGETPAPSVEAYRTELGHAALAEAAEVLNAAGAALVSSGADDRAMAGFTAPKFTVTEEGGETAVSFAFSFDIGDDDPVPSKRPAESEATFYKVTQTRMSLVGSAPIEGDADISTLFQGDSLVRGFKAKLALSQLSNTLGDGAGAGTFVNRAYGECIREQAGLWLRDNPAQADAYAAFLSDVETRASGTVAGKQRGRAIALRQLAAGKPEASIAYTVHFACAPGDTKKGSRFGDEGGLVHAYTDLYSEFASRFYDERSWLRFRGVDASVGQDDYTYLDRALFATPEEKRTSWEVGAYYGFINPTATFSARVRGVYGRTWELPEEGEACETVGDPPAEQCLTGPDGPPNKVETGLVSFETRHLFALGAERSIAFAPQLTYRFEDDAVGVEVPVYLSPDEQGALTGGLKLAWTSKDDEFGVGVFVGVPFSIFIE